jgi:hypothetical protein
MQIGYNVAELNETISDRLKLIPAYLLGFTGVEASPEEIEIFSTYAHQFDQVDM